LEDLGQAGASNFIFLSYARPVNDEFKQGSILLPTRAVRDEGTSFHFLKPGKQVTGNMDIEKKIKELLKKNSLRAKTGLVWSTDAPYSKVRKTREIIESKALAIDNDSSALFAVARNRNLNVGGILLVTESTIRGKVTEKIKDPLKELKAHLLGICVELLSAKSFWDSLGEEKVQEKIAPKEERPKNPIWDEKINAIAARIETEALKAKAVGKEELILEALEIKKELFLSQYNTTRSKYIRGKANVKTYSKVSIACSEVLEKIYATIVELEAPGDQYMEIVSRADNVFDYADDAVEDIYDQLLSEEQPPAYAETEKPLMPLNVHSNRLSVFLVNLPRRFRYKPFYKQFFEGSQMVTEVHHEEFTKESAFE